MITDSVFEHAIRTDPHDTDRVKVYADWIEEQNGCSRWAALKAAAKPRVQTLNALEVQRASRLLRPGTVAASIRRLALFDVAKVPEFYVPVIRVVPGSRPPVLVTPSTASVFFRYHLSGVYVGARWVLGMPTTRISKPKPSSRKRGGQHSPS